MRGKLSIVGCLLALAMLLGACGGRESVRPADSKPTAPASEAPNRAEVRAAMAEGLIGDRENARHTAGPIPRQSEQLDPPPAPKQVRTPPPVQPQAADKAIVEEAGLPKAAETPPPAKVAKPDPAKTHPTPAPPSPAEKLASGPGYRAQLGAFRSKAKAVRARRSLTDALNGVVDERLFAIDDSGNDGFVRVVLSRTFATRRAATAACAVIKERGRDCFVARIR